ncbi:PE family protein, partial [Mycobacterium asiaticum]|uniref:PE family protein n=1 Tax=Mycobacterium asiaticum TaxID=1790 RepID=UPI0009BF5971
MSSYVFVSPEDLVVTASNLRRIGSDVGAAGVAAGVSTTGLAAAAGDEVSAAIAALFGTYGREYQAVSAAAAEFHARFVQLMAGTAGTYGAMEAASAASLQSLEQALLDVINAPTNSLLGRPLVGPGVDGAAGSGAAGGAGGLLIGRGGNGGSGGP